MKKYLLGFLAIVLAVGFSAFTSVKKSLPATQYRFYNTTGSTSTNPADFVFYSNPDLCETSSQVCSAVWDQSVAPSDGQQPASGASYIGNEEQGTFQQP